MSFNSYFNGKNTSANIAYLKEILRNKIMLTQLVPYLFYKIWYLSGEWEKASRGRWYNMKDDHTYEVSGVNLIRT